MQRAIVSIILPLCLFLGMGSKLHANEMADNLKGIKNISQPHSNRYGAGQPRSESFLAIANAGVKHIINLRPPSETPDVNEAAIVTQAGMAYYNIPIASGAELTRDKVVLIDKILTTIGDEPVLIHCSSSNRVGAIMALKAVWLDKKSTENAIAIGHQWGLTSLQPAVEKLLLK